MADAIIAVRYPGYPAWAGIDPKTWQTTNNGVRLPRVGGDRPH